MTIYVAACYRSVPGMGRSDQNHTYVQIVGGVRQLAGKENLSAYLASEPSDHPWNDPNSNEFIVEITKQEYDDILSGAFPLNWGVNTQPKWQQRTATSGATKEWGSFSDAKSSASAWQPDTPIGDTRLTWEIYNGDPDAGGTHVAHEQFEESQAPGYVTRHILQFNPNGTRSNTNKQNQYTYIGGKRFIFDFTNGVTTIELSTTMATVTGDGILAFSQERDLKIRGPGGEDTYVAEFFRRRAWPV